jgi:glycosyltransferase involved in cell wall biosynthesis
VVEHVRRLRTAGKTAVAAIHVHGGDVYLRSRWRRKPAAWSKLTHALRAADRVITSTEVMRQTVLEIIGPSHPNGHVCIVPNGVDEVDPQAQEPCPRFESAPFATQPFVLALGRLIARKGFDTLIEALPEAGLTGMSVVIAGDGPERPRLEQLCRDRPPPCPVHFVGTVDGPDKRWLLQNCLVMAAPSVEESFGIVALEAMSFGKPVIGTSGTGFAEIIQPGRQGSHRGIAVQQSGFQ